VLSRAEARPPCRSRFASCQGPEPRPSALARAAVATGQERAIIRNALALFMGAAMFRQRGSTDSNEQVTEDFRIGTMRARVGLRRLSQGDVEMVEEDYYRLLHAPRG
jgi:hypothetical protein